MTAALLTFVLILAVVYGVYWALILRPEGRAQALLRRRLRGAQPAAGVAESSLVQAPAPLSAVGALNVLLERSGGLSGPLDRLVTQSGLRITVGMLVLASGLLGGVAFLVVQVLAHYSLLALAAALAAATLPYLVVRHVRTRRLNTFEEQFPDAVEMMARALRAGHAFPTAVL